MRFERHFGMYVLIWPLVFVCIDSFPAPALKLPFIYLNWLPFSKVMGVLEPIPATTEEKAEKHPGSPVHHKRNTQTNTFPHTVTHRKLEDSVEKTHADCTQKIPSTGPTGKRNKDLLAMRQQCYPLFWLINYIWNKKNITLEIWPNYSFNIMFCCGEIHWFY